ncbi:MAG: hypothetical protein ISS87_02435 [Candidatus Pacebacteria bacterium]|nr:hypothetical protein [Candidatus Paceibacterota bacterium]
MNKKAFIVSLITGIWGLLSSIFSFDNIRHSETLWWYSGALFEKIILLPAYLTNLAGNPFMPVLQGEGVVITPLSAKMWHVVISALIGVSIGVGISIVINKYEKGVKDASIT